MTDYILLCKQIEALAESTKKPIPLMANTSALLNEALSDINWVGFYVAEGDELLLGPFQGKVACTVIEKGKGVCGTVFLDDKVQLVSDVHDFPGHIACDAVSRSEIVLPMHHEGAVVAVLDIDSPVVARFTEDDRNGLMEVVKTLESRIEWD